MRIIKKKHDNQIQRSQPRGNYYRENIRNTVTRPDYHLQHYILNHSPQVPQSPNWILNLPSVPSAPPYEEDETQM